MTPLVGHLNGKRYARLYIEMKHGTNTLTEAQEAFRDAIGDSMAFVVAYSEKAASTAIVDYLGCDHPAVLEAIK